MLSTVILMSCLIASVLCNSYRPRSYEPVYDAGSSHIGRGVSSVLRDFERTPTWRNDAIGSDISWDGSLGGQGQWRNMDSDIWPSNQLNQWENRRRGSRWGNRRVGSYEPRRY